MLNTIKASAKRVFNFFGPLKGDNQLATIKDVNDVILGINNRLAEKKSIFQLVPHKDDEGVYIPYAKITGGGCLVCSATENSQFTDGCFCYSCGCLKYKGAGGIKSVTMDSPGVYVIELDFKGMGEFNSVDMRISNLSDKGTYIRRFVGGDTTGKSGFVITTYDDTWSEVQDLLDYAELELSFYTHPVLK
jgi:hypothetical protein